MLAALLLALAALIGVLVLTRTPAAYAVEAIDRNLIFLMRQPANPDVPGGSWWLRRAFGDITALGGHTVVSLFSLLAIGYLLITRKPRAALLLVVAVAGGMLVSDVLKAALGRPRPDLVPTLVQTYSSSFPSGHSMLSASTYLTIGALLTRLVRTRPERLYIIGATGAVTLLVGLSRVYLGVHWPSDVLAGWCIGAAWALCCWLVATRLQRRGKVEQVPGAGDAVRVGLPADATPSDRPD